MPTVRDDLLATILDLWRQLIALPSTNTGKGRETPEHKALIKQIRAVVDARTKARGNEMIEVSDPCDENHTKE